ncbi:MAG: SRPBCC family protein, partial [Verrucomicrobiota bacterium]
MNKWLVILLSTILMLSILSAVFLRPSGYSLERSTIIDLPPREVYDVVQNLKEWREWSPWLLIEPDAEVTFEGEGRAIGDAYSWKGEVVGEGTMTHREAEEFRRLVLALSFVKPFKSSAEVTFFFEPEAGGEETRVRWQMEGTIPHAMRSMMTTMIGRDYERGLALLKDYAERGEVRSRTEALGETARPALSYVGVRNSSNLNEISSDMEPAMEALQEALAGSGLALANEWYVIYDQFQMLSGDLEFVIAIPVARVPDPLP